MNFLYFFLFINPPCSAATQIGTAIKCISGVRLYGKTSTVGIQISLIIFIGGQKVRNLTSFKHHSTLSHPHLKIQQDIRIVKQKCNAAMMASLAKLGPRTLRKLCQFWPTP